MGCCLYEEWQGNHVGFDIGTKGAVERCMNEGDAFAVGADVVE